MNADIVNINDKLIISTLDGTFTLFDPNSNNIIYLNSTASFLFANLCKSPQKTNNLLISCAKQYNHELSSKLEQDLTNFIDLLIEKNVVYTSNHKKISKFSLHPALVNQEPNSASWESPSITIKGFCDVAGDPPGQKDFPVDGS